jgi:hypothetical protein
MILLLWLTSLLLPASQLLLASLIIWRYRGLGCCWHTGCCLPGISCWVPCRCWYRCCVASVSAVAGIPCCHRRPFCCRFPFCSWCLYYCRRLICCFSVVAGFPADSGISAVAEVSAVTNVLGWCGRRLCCCFQYGVCTVYSQYSIECNDGKALYQITNVSAATNSINVCRNIRLLVTMAPRWF